MAYNFREQYSNSLGGEVKVGEIYGRYSHESEEQVITCKFPICCERIINQLNLLITGDYTCKSDLPTTLYCSEGVSYPITEATNEAWLKHSYEFISRLEYGGEELTWLINVINFKMECFNDTGNIYIMEDMVKVAKILQEYYDDSCCLYEGCDDWEELKSFFEENIELEGESKYLFSNAETIPNFIEEAYNNFCEKYKGDIKDYYARKIQRRFKEKLYNPHTELGKKFALKQISWAFEEE